MRSELATIGFPLAAGLASRFLEHSTRAGDIRDLAAEEVREKIRHSLATPHFPFLQELADSIVSLSLSCVTQVGEDYYFTLSDEEGFPLHLPVGSCDPMNPAWMFEFKNVHGLREFLVMFGGLVDGHMPPGACVYTADECKAMHSALDSRTGLPKWGNIKGWEGARAIFHSGCGDLLVILPGGSTGRWCHEIGWAPGNEPAVVRLEHSFAELVENYAQMLRLPFSKRLEVRSPWN